MENQKENRCVIFLDSGIGGIPYFRHFCRRNPGQCVAYVADRLHFPYGKRGRDELSEILTEIAERVVQTLDP